MQRDKAQAIASESLKVFMRDDYGSDSQIRVRAALDAGYRAAECGLDRKDNPFGRGEEQGAWMEGFDQY